MWDQQGRRLYVFLRKIQTDKHTLGLYLFGKTALHFACLRLSIFLLLSRWNRSILILYSGGHRRLSGPVPQDLLFRQWMWQSPYVDPKCFELGPRQSQAPPLQLETSSSSWPEAFSTVLEVQPGRHLHSFRHWIRTPPGSSLAGGRRCRGTSCNQFQTCIYPWCGSHIRALLPHPSPSVRLHPVCLL